MFQNYNDKEFDVTIEGYKLFYAIAVIVLFNTLMYYTGNDFSLVFGLGFTDVLNYYGSSVDENQIKYLFASISIIVGLFYILFGYFSKKGMKSMLFIGFFIYVIDMFTFLYYLDPIGALAHAVIIKLLYDYYTVYE